MGIKTARRHLRRLPSSFDRQEALLALDDVEEALMEKPDTSANIIDDMTSMVKMAFRESAGPALEGSLGAIEDGFYMDVRDRFGRRAEDELRNADFFGTYTMNVRQAFRDNAGPALQGSLAAVDDGALAVFEDLIGGLGPG